MWICLQEKFLSSLMIKCINLAYSKGKKLRLRFVKLKKLSTPCISRLNTIDIETSSLRYTIVAFPAYIDTEFRFSKSHVKHYQLVFSKTVIHNIWEIKFKASKYTRGPTNPSLTALGIIKKCIIVDYWYWLNIVKEKPTEYLPIDS